MLFSARKSPPRCYPAQSHDICYRIWIEKWNARFRTQLAAIMKGEPPDRLPASDLLLLSGVGVLLIVTEAVAVGVPVLLSSLDVVIGYNREAIVCV